VSPHLGPSERFFTTCITNLPPGVFTTCILLDLVWYALRVGRVVRLSPMIAAKVEKRKRVRLEIYVERMRSEERSEDQWIL